MSILGKVAKPVAVYGVAKVTYNKIKHHVKHQKKEQYDQARTSSKRSSISWYLKEFNNRLKTAELDELERMLDCQEYEVPFDSSNDYYRRYKLEERIHLLRTEQEKQVESAKREFSRWLEASKSDIDVLEAGLANGKYHIRYDSDNDDARRSQLEAELRPLQEKRKKECAEILNNLKKLTFNTACKLAISQSIICLRGFQCRESFAKATSQPPCVGYDADENAKQYAEAQRNFFELFCKYEAQFETIYDGTDPSDKDLLSSAYFEAATYCQSIDSEKAAAYYKKSAALGNEEAAEVVKSLP